MRCDKPDLKRLGSAAAFAAALILLPGCIVGNFIGGAAQNFEYQKKVEVLAEYSGLENKTVAVLVVADLATQYEHPDVIPAITGGVSQRLRRDVPGAQVMDERFVIQWQYRTPQWEAMSYGEIAKDLGVDRVVYIDVYEYRLNPPGNRWEWQGVAAATVGVIERDGLDPDGFADQFDIIVKFPDIEGVGRESATAERIQYGLLAKFIQEASWLFHTHIRPKYPDRYDPRLDPDVQQQ